ncbi:hypothetical protein, partial [Clostridium sp. Cult2]|uniref:hypothetical protein n=1 Tax=Clostridium sp. Cult2 TaxID=2079003 RepID=UPI001F2A3864
MKKNNIFALIMAFLFVMSTVACASNNYYNDNESIEMIDIEIDYSSQKILKDGSVEYDIKNKEQVADFLEIDIDKIRNIKITKPNYIIKESNLNNSDITPFANIYIANITGPRQACGSNRICENSAVNHAKEPLTKTMTLSGTVSNSHSLSVDAGIDAEIASISAAVGFNVERSWTMTDSTQVELEPGQRVTVVAFPYWDVYS